MTEVQKFVKKVVEAYISDYPGGKEFILSLMGESEVGVLDAPQPSHGDLLAVGESHASGADQSEDSEQTSAGTLEIN